MEPTKPTIQWVNGIRQPVPETKNQTRSNNSRNDERDITAMCVRLIFAYRTAYICVPDSCTFVYRTAVHLCTGQLYIHSLFVREMSGLVIQ
jgi:hypothetical protein